MLLFKIIAYNLQGTIYSVHCTLYAVQCITYNVQRTIYRVQCIAYTVLRTMYIVKCIAYNLQGTMYSVQCITYNVQRVMYSVQCITYNVQGTIYRVQCIKYNVQCRVFWVSYLKAIALEALQRLELQSFGRYNSYLKDGAYLVIYDIYCTCIHVSPHLWLLGIDQYHGAYKYLGTCKHIIHLQCSHIKSKL